MEQRLSLVTLGVADLARARSFYERLGWSATGDPPGSCSSRPAAWSSRCGTARQLAQDSTTVDSGGWGGVTLAHNVGSPAEVDAVIEEARAAGATIGREPAETFWGGYSGVFLDPDGHPWEIAHNPHWTLDPDGAVRL